MKIKHIVPQFAAALLLATGPLVHAAALLAPGNPLVGVAASPGSASSAVSVAGTTAGANNYPSAEAPNLAIDGLTSSKYLNFAKVNAGLIVTVPGGLTTVTGLVFTTANDAPERDPLTVVLEGTSAPDPTTAAGNATWTTLYTGTSGLTADPGRFQAGTFVSFANAASFNTYRLLITDVRNAASANSLQFSEVQFHGLTPPDAVAPTLASKLPAPGTVGSLSNITVTFSEGVLGVAASDLLVNGTPATGVSGSGTTYTFSFPQPPLGPVTVGFNPLNGITDFSSTPNAFDETAPNASWSYTLVDNTAPTVVNSVPAANTTVTQLRAIQVAFSEPVTGVDAADLQINGISATNVLAASPQVYTFEFGPVPTGAVTVAFIPAHGIVDQAAAPNAFAGASWDYNYDPGFTFTKFAITEFLANNSGNGSAAIRDEDGDSSDWIEIYNPDATTADISGWFLTDATSSPTKWRFPNGTTVPGRGYIVVFASGKNRTNAAPRLHTNFQLNNTGEYLGLLNPSTNVVSEFAPVYPAQSTDISYGRDRANNDIVGYYTTPTPGANNAQSGAGFAGEVIFSRPGGTFAGSFQLALAVNEPNTVIRYTVVSSAQDSATATNIPTANSPLYTGPITITNTAQVRARAFPANPNVFPGPPHTECYVSVSTNITNFVSTLPIVVLHTMSSASLSGGYPSLDNSIIVQTFETNANGLSSLMGKPQLTKRGGVNLRGSSTQGFPKGSYAVELWDEFNQDESAEFLGMPKESDWVLYAPNQFDLSLMHNRILHQFGRDFGHYSSRTRFVEVFVRNGSGAISASTNGTGTAMGDYAGVYVLEEKVKIDGSRLDIDKLEPEMTNAPAITGGYLLKIDRTDGNERTFSGGGETINYQDPDGLEMVTPARSRQASYISSYFNFFNTGLQGTALTNIASTNHYSRYLDIDATIDLHIVNVLTMNADAYRLSGYIHKPRNGKLIFGPLWDVDRGLGTSRGDSRTYAPRSWQSYDASSCGGTDYGTDFFQGTTPPVWLGRLFSDVDFWQRWIDRYQDWRGTMLDSNRVLAIVDKFASEVREAQPREQKRWSGNGGSATQPRSGVVNNCANTFSHTFDGTYQGEVDFQKRWLIEHLHFMDTNLLNRPGFSITAGQVASGTTLTLVDLSGKAGSQIFYTLDGSDPRGFQGTTNASAIAYTGPITITSNVQVRVRAFNPNHRNLTGLTASGSRNPVVSSSWSGMNSAIYVVATPTLIVSELMYNPAPASGSDTNDADNFEFIELKNIGANPLNLAGFHFTRGVDFTFGNTIVAAGDYVLVVKNTNSFNSRYGSVAKVAGQFGGNLANDGERITLVGAASEAVIDFEYKDGWSAPQADGLGFSLVVQNENAVTDLSTNTSWRASSLENGSPGSANPPATVQPTILLNEALTHTDPPQVDSIELYNPGTNSVDVGGWFLTDDFGAPRKFQIPANTIIPAGGYAVFDENQFGASFLLSSVGDEVYVFSGANGLLTGFYHGHSFGAAQNGVSFGRYVNSQGEEHFVAQASNTLGAANSGPLVGPAVISEIMYHPADIIFGPYLLDNALDEYVEIQNVSGAPVNLFDPANPRNTWRLGRAVDFYFPTNLTLPVGGRILVVGFDPADATLQANFRSKFGVPAEVPVVGPFVGQLDNSADGVRLSRPDNPNLTEVPYILVDRVNYTDSLPWPFPADGFGASLQRRLASAYGDDPTNWTAARPTAGTQAEGGALPVITQQPQGVTITEGSTLIIPVVVDSPTPATYQWGLNGRPLEGQTNSSLNIPNIAFDQAGTYSVAVFNGGGGAFSSNAVVVVLPVPVISQAPFSQSVQPGTNVNFSVVATGTGPLRYQWRYNGNAISGATNALFILTNAQLEANAGLYDVLVSDNIGTRTSPSATLIVLVRPTITFNPLPVTVLQGGTARFSVVAGPIHPLLPLSYRWLRNGQLWVSNQNPNLVITNCQSNGTFRVQVVNLAGTANSVPSSGVALTVLADLDRDGIADAYELQYGLSTNNAADALLDLDGDGLDNRGEYVAGTDPTNSLSYLKLEPIQFPGGNQTALEFVAVSNRTYTVDFRDSLSFPWTNLFTIPGAGSNRVLRLTNSAAAPMRVYRLSIPPAD